MAKGKAMVKEMTMEKETETVRETGLLIMAG
jgi:hypothetical protein